VTCAQAFEAAGSDDVHRANTVGLIHVIAALIPVDLSSAEAEPIITQLRDCRSSLQFMLDNNVVCVKSLALNSVAQAVVNAAFWIFTLCVKTLARKYTPPTTACLNLMLLPFLLLLAGVVLTPVRERGRRRFRVFARTLQRTTDCLAGDILWLPCAL
jgi:hypothetical protein